MKRVLSVLPRSPSHPQPLGSRPVMLIVVCALALAACAEDRDAVTGPRSPTTALVDAGYELTDPAIDATDTYLVTTSVTRTTTTIESAEPFVDPLTGQTVTSLTFPDVVDSARFEAGYDAGGTVRMNESRVGNDAGGPAERVVVAGNTATFYDRFGAIVHDTSGAMLMDALGSTDDIIVTSEAVIRESDAPLSAGGASQPSLAIAGPVAAAAPQVERRGDRLVKRYSLNDPASGISGHREREYRRSGQDWVVAEERVETMQGVGTMELRIVETTLYPTVKWRNNPDRDAQRRARRSTAPSAGSDGIGPRAHAPTAAIASAGVRPAGDRQGSADAQLAGSVASECFLCAEDGGTDEVDPRLYNPGPPVNLALQHGAFADASNFARMDAWLTMRHNVVFKVKPSLAWRELIEVQAAELTRLLRASGGTNFLVIGHSNGGLVGRYAAQQESALADRLIGGVATIASPHRGVPLAQNTRAGVNILLTGQFNRILASIGGSCGKIQFNWLCGIMTDAGLTLVPSIVNYAFDQGIPMSGQVRPGSSFLGALNGGPEPFFKYSVEVESQGMWKFIRMLGDWKCNPEDRCSGHHLQNIMESVYDVLRYCGSNELSKLMNAALAERCRSVRWSLNSANTLYERLTAPGDNSDGLVPAKSQAYPGVATDQRFRVLRARESHSGELKSSTIRDRLNSIIDHYSTFGV